MLWFQKVIGALSKGMHRTSNGQGVATPLQNDAGIL